MEIFFYIRQEVQFVRIRNTPQQALSYIQAKQWILTDFFFFKDPTGAKYGRMEEEGLGDKVPALS